ncbi:MAG: signal recognition particle receptor subunit alpha, partial [Actinobacteria bacterium]|nr:signal recognition particle receptor subunit alpha [Actinomycetota bacterium]
MFDNLSDRLERITDRLKGRGRINEADLTEALAEIRSALLEADVELGVTTDLLQGVREQCADLERSKSL